MNKISAGDWTLEHDGSLCIGGQVVASPRHLAPDGASREEGAANARLMAEAGVVANKTGLTPAQLVERCHELFVALESATTTIKALDEDFDQRPSYIAGRAALAQARMINNDDLEAYDSAVALARDTIASVDGKPDAPKPKGGMEILVAEATELLRNAEYNDGQAIVLTQDCESLEAVLAQVTGHALAESAKSGDEQQNGQPEYWEAWESSNGDDDPMPFRIDAANGRVVAWIESEQDARLIAEAGTLSRKTGLTPRQLAAQRARLLEVASWAVAAFAHCEGLASNEADRDVFRQRRSFTWETIHGLGKVMSDDVERQRAIGEFMGLVARMHIDGEDDFVMEGDDDVTTLIELIAEARRLTGEGSGGVVAEEQKIKNRRMSL